MEDPAKIVAFGDSIVKEWAPLLEKKLKKRYPKKNITVINQGITGDTSEDGLKRARIIPGLKPNVVLIGFGMNDWRKGISKKIYQKNISEIINILKKPGIRVILIEVTPDYNGRFYEFSKKRYTGTSRIIDTYNEVLQKLARENKLRIVMANALWKREIKPLQKGLRDAIHPNSLGKKIILKALLRVVPQDHITILWQFNGRFGFCNYACEYCYRPTSCQKERTDIGDIKKWKRAFKRSFGDEKIVFYLSYGEPTIAKKFFEVIKMVSSEPKWSIIMTSNLSSMTVLKKMVKYPIVKEGRMHINASFHATQIDQESFIKRLLFLRKHGIEAPVVFVMWPPLIKKFEKEYFPKFYHNNFYVHVRRFQGFYKGKKYPKSYSSLEWTTIAKYQNSADLKYIMDEKSAFGRLTHIGMYHILVNSKGDIEMCDSYYGDGHYGNIFKDVWLDLEPQPFPGPIPLSAVDDIASYVELDYNQLENNHILSYAFQGGVKRTKEGRYVYPFYNTDFKNKKIVKKLCSAPSHKKQRLRFLLSLKWFFEQFIMSLIIRKYFREIAGIIKGKFALLKRKKLRQAFNWHS
ncbi:hypothetical protein GF323_04560 [Candidatus Woesearchaeota archaeon]|nr:hypothetical protein [Candidatus Woesearchaeota archaeon]